MKNVHPAVRLLAYLLSAFAIPTIVMLFIAGFIYFVSDLQFKQITQSVPY